MYHTILIPLENSPHDSAILAHVRPLARLHGSRLVLIHVADGHAARNQEQLNLEDSSEIVDDRAYLAREAGALRAEGFDVEFVLAKGDPASQIVREAQALPADLIAMSTHGHGLVKDLILGSVAHSVRHRTLVPVLLVRSERTD